MLGGESLITGTRWNMAERKVIQKDWGGGAGKELEDAETEPGNKRLSKYFHRAKRVVMTT